MKSDSHRTVPANPAIGTKYRPWLALVHLVPMAVVLTGCASYSATAEAREELRYEAVRVQPGWEYRDRPALKLILPAIGASAGAGYGYATEFTYQERTFAGSENAAIWAGAGLVAGFLLNGMIFPKPPYSRRAFDPTQSDEWLASWNRETEPDFMISGEGRNNSLILVPRASVLAIRRDYRSLEADLAKAKPSTSYGDLQEWKGRLAAEYSILPAEELRQVEDLIARHESKVAAADLESRLPAVDAMENEYGSIPRLLRLGQELGPVYKAADAATRERFDRRVHAKIGLVLTHVIPEEERKVDGVDSSISGFQELDDLYRAFDQRYRTLRDHDLVSGGYDHFRARREALIQANAGRIASLIRAATTVRQLDGLETRYFAGLQSEAPAVTGVLRQIHQRKQAILDEDRRRTIAARSEAQRRAWAALEAERASLAAENAGLGRTSLSTSGLSNASLVDALYTGEVDGIALRRDDPRFAVLYTAYLESYAQQCRDHLPRNAVMMTRQECQTERVTTNGWGVETGRTCISWRTVNTGLYADPAMYSAKKDLDLVQATDAFRNVMAVLGSDNPFAEGLEIYGDALTMKRDMATLVRRNECDGPGLRRFQDNLRLFALAERPKRLSGHVPVSHVITPPPGTLFEDQNYTRLLEDLVARESASWAMNRFHRGSVAGASVTSRDPLGRPAEVKARYGYEGFSGRSSGTVTLKFGEGWPECLYFSDNPVACRTPDAAIVRAYADGRYGR